MTKNKKIKILMLIIFLIVILLNNFSYANYIITKSQLKESLEKVLLSEVKIEQKSESELGTSSAVITMGAPEEGEKIIVEDSKIRYIIEEYNIEMTIDYSIENEKCIFNTVLDINDENVSNMDEAMIKVALALAQNFLVQKCYIAVSDAMGLDNSLTYTYYMQQYKDADEVKNDIYNLTRKQTEDRIEYNLEIDMEQLSKLDSSKIDSASYVKVTINKQGNEEKEEQEEEKKPEETQKPENKEDEKVIVDKNTTNSNQQKVNTNKSVNTDNTIAKTTIPKTGKTMGLCVIIAVLIVIALITYERYKKYKEVK